jgi:xylan 1,4-beta-xylosidase
MTIELKAEAGAPGAPLKHFWNFGGGAGRANQGLRADWPEPLLRARGRFAMTGNWMVG